MSSTITSGQPLSSLYLDFNHDDYYGHSGSWADIQDSLWLHRVSQRSNDDRNC